MFRNITALLGIALGAFAAAAQSPETPSTISGTVTNSVTGEPVLRAHVAAHCSLPEGQNNRQTYGALTTAEGKFSITPPPDSNCSIAADRTGFVPSYSAASQPAGTQKSEIKLALTPAGVISGRVVDAEGEPVMGVQVQAEGAQGSSGVTTDDTGHFRIGGLRPGKYRVKASPESMPFPPEIRSDGKPDFRDATTYYPQSVASKEAQKVEVKPATEIRGIDIRLERTPVVGVSGKVTGVPTGVKGLMVTARPGGHSAVVKPDGTFTIWRLDPGKYVLITESHSGEMVLSSSPLDIEVSGVNLDHLELRIIPAFEVTGRVRYEEEAARQPQQTRDAENPNRPIFTSRLILQSLEQEDWGTATGPVAADDGFAIERVQPGKYRVTVSWDGAYVRSIRAGDREVEGNVVDLRNGDPGPLTFSLSSQLCEVSGTVNDSKGPAANASVVISGGSYMYSTATDSSGTFRFVGLAPGKYTMTAMDERPENVDGSPVSFDDYEDVSETLELRAGDKVSKDLKRHPAQ